MVYLNSEYSTLSKCSVFFQGALCTPTRNVATPLLKLSSGEMALWTHRCSLRKLLFRDLRAEPRQTLRKHMTNVATLKYDQKTSKRKHYVLCDDRCNYKKAYNETSLNQVFKGVLGTRRVSRIRKKLSSGPYRSIPGT